MKGVDALVKAKTGTGKTLAFLIPAIEMLIRAKHRIEKLNRANKRETNVISSSSSFSLLPNPRILILSPTRELAQQIQQEAEALCSFHKIGSVIFVGGKSMSGDLRQIDKPVEGNTDIVVATPGRLLAHLTETKKFAKQLKAVEGKLHFY